jgi:outer membrane lipoprotein carrier protein
MHSLSRFPSLRTFRAVAVATAAFALAGLAAPARAQDAPAPQAPAPVAAPAADVAAVTAQVQGFYDLSTSFEADFTQEYWVKQYNVKKQSHGRVTFKKPGKMLWKYDVPPDNRLVSDGHKLKIYTAENKQMFEQDVSASQYPAVLSFLSGQGKLGDTFDFQLFDGSQMSFPGGWVLVGTPKTATPAYQKVFFYVDKETKQVRRVLILDGQGNHNRFDFDKPTLNGKIDDARFVFSPPPGTSIIRP